MIWAGEYFTGLRLCAQYIWQTSNTLKMKLFKFKNPSSALSAIAQNLLVFK